jgi:DNA-binding response OmpR family regulator
MSGNELEGPCGIFSGLNRLHFGGFMRVLVAEDDRALGLFLQKGLMLEGHDVEWVGDGDAALHYAMFQRPDLMVLDLSLPGLDGTEVLEAMRGRCEGTAVLVLTGRSPVEERVRCLNLGADDCLLKPFSFHELSARCRAILRRKERFSDPTLRYGGLEMNRLERRVRYHDTSVDLTTKEFLLLEFLLQRQGQCATRTELMSEVWQSSPEAGANVVDVYVNYLRKKLAAAHPEEMAGSAIETVRGRGYRLRGANISSSAYEAQPALAAGA